MRKAKGIGPVPTPETLPPNRREGGTVRGVQHVQNFGAPRSEWDSAATSSARFTADSTSTRVPSRDPAGLFLGVALRPRKK